MITKFIKAALFIFCAFIFSTAASYSSEEIIEFPITSAQDIVSSGLVEIDPENDSALIVNSSGKSEVILFDLDGSELGEKRLTYSARMRTEDLKAEGDSRGIAYLELTALFPDGEELAARGPRVPLSGTTDWRAGNTVLYVDRGDNPERVRLALIVEGNGKAWIGDVQLRHRPLRTDYLFWGHVVVWVALIIYIYHLIRKQRRLERELKSIEAGA